VQVAVALGAPPQRVVQLPQWVGSVRSSVQPLSQHD
jgi:hypothetical protein